MSDKSKSFKKVCGSSSGDRNTVLRHLSARSYGHRHSLVWQYLGNYPGTYPNCHNADDVQLFAAYLRTAPQFRNTVSARSTAQTESDSLYADNRRRCLLDSGICRIGRTPVFCRYSKNCGNRYLGGNCFRGSVYNVRLRDMGYILHICKGLRIAAGIVRDALIKERNLL